MLAYKIWWVNWDKQHWEGEGTGKKLKKKHSQGVKKLCFTACHWNKLQPAFSSPRLVLTGSIFCFFNEQDWLQFSCKFKRELKQRRFWATHVNRKWTFCTLEPWFWTNFWADRLCKNEDTWQYKYGSVKAYWQRKRLTSAWRASFKNVAA